KVDCEHRLELDLESDGAALQVERLDHGRMQFTQVANRLPANENVRAPAGVEQGSRGALVGDIDRRQRVQGPLERPLQVAKVQPSALGTVKACSHNAEAQRLVRLAVRLLRPAEVSPCNLEDRHRLAAVVAIV